MIDLHNGIWSSLIVTDPDTGLVGRILQTRSTASPRTCSSLPRTDGSLSRISQELPKSAQKILTKSRNGMVKIDHPRVVQMGHKWFQVTKRRREARHERHGICKCTQEQNNNYEFFTTCVISADCPQEHWMRVSSDHDVALKCSFDLKTCSHLRQRTEWLMLRILSSDHYSQ